jgi:hypothetical protein
MTAVVTRIATATKSKQSWSTKGWEASVWRNANDWRKWERVGMAPTYTLDDLALEWVDKRVDNLELKGAITSVSMTRSIEQATNFVVVVRDPEGRIFNRAKGRVTPQKTKAAADIDIGWQKMLPPNMVGRAVDIYVDDVPYRLSKVGYNYGTSEVSLTFEDRVINWLRRKGGRTGHPGIERKASRKSSTRAEFILALLREIRIETVPFICPELHKKQPISKTKTVDNKVVIHADTGRSGFSGTNLTVKDEPAKVDQIRNADHVLTRASQADGADKRSVTACMAAVIVESQIRNLRKGDKDSLGILQVRVSTSGSRDKSLDIDWCVDQFMTKGFWGKGGAVDVAKKHPNETIGWIAQQVQGSGVPDAYDKWLNEAEAFVSAWQGGDLPDSTGGTYNKSYQYTRDKEEDSWTCIQRLADEVNWRCFMVGRAMYFMSEDDLFRQRVRYVISEGDPAFIDLDYDIDWGKPINEATLTVSLGQWDAPPGSIIQLDKFGIPDGRWLVTDIDRDWYSPVAQVTIKQPSAAKPEPASEQNTRNAQDTSDPWLDVDADSKAGRLYTECQRISDNAAPYLYGGSHGPPLSQVASNDRMDCSSSCSLALYRAGMFKGTTAITSGTFATSWGKPGKGKYFTVWANSEHVWIEFHGVGQASRFDTSGHGEGTSGDGPHLRMTKRTDQSRFTARHWGSGVGASDGAINLREHPSWVDKDRQLPPGARRGPLPGA